MCLKLYRIKIKDAEYNWQAGMSNNAVQAYNEGKLPLSKITSSELQKWKIPLSVQDFKKAIDLKLLYPSEWHHSSKFYNKTNFYDLKEIARDNDKEDWEYIKNKINPPKEKRIHGIFEYQGKQLRGVWNPNNNEVFLSDSRENVPFNKVKLIKQDKVVLVESKRFL